MSTHDANSRTTGEGFSDSKGIVPELATADSLVEVEEPRTGKVPRKSKIDRENHLQQQRFAYIRTLLEEWEPQGDDDPDDDPALKFLLTFKTAIAEGDATRLAECFEFIGLGPGDAREAAEMVLNGVTEDVNESARREERPVILLQPGRSPEILAEMETILVPRAAEFEVFQRVTELVRVVKIQQAVGSNGLRREAGTIMLAPMTRECLAKMLEIVVEWQKSGKNGPREVDCPDRICRMYLASVGEWRLPVLAGIISAPIVRWDGTVLYQKGYDPQTCLYLTEAWDQPPECPSMEDALKALATLRAPFSEFPFVEPVDESVFLCGILTAIQRRLLPTAPGFGFTAPSPRTGKSKLAECLALIATGRQAAAMAVAREQEEIRKAVVAALREGHAIVNLDNVEHVLASPDLSRAITQTEYADRLLGETRILRVPTNLLWTATGNNLTFQGDLATRFLLCRLDACLERPENRTFKICNLEEYIYRNRRTLVQAALTILAAYNAAGSPSQQLTEYGGFEEWSRKVRSPLVWLGLPDPCLSRDNVLANDPGREGALTLLQAWYATVPDSAISLNQLIRVSSTHGPLHEVLTAVAPLEARNLQGVDVKKLAYWCRQWKGRVVGEFRLRSENRHKDGMHWYVEKLESRR